MKKRRSDRRNVLDPLVQSALNTVGVPSELVFNWLGSCVGCKTKRRNRAWLADWASRLNRGTMNAESALIELEQRIKS